MSDQHEMHKAQVREQVINELMLVVGNKDVTYTEAGEYLGTLHRAAEERQDVRAMHLISLVWERVQALDRHGGASIDIAVAAKEVALQLDHDLNTVTEYAEGLQRAIQNVDEGNPMVRDLVDNVREEHWTDIVESGVYLSTCPGCDITESAMIPVTHDMALVFHSMLMGEYDLTSEQQHELAEFIQYFVRTVNDSGANVA